MNNNIELVNSQYADVDFNSQLSDKNLRGEERPWQRYKLANEYLALAYDEIDKKKSERLRACGKFLLFDVDENNNKRLVSANSCRVRLCPLCAWRRSLKCFHDTMRIVQYMQENDSKSYIFVTLTVKNCVAEKLSETLDLLFSAVKRLYERKEVRCAWKGCVRNLEVTHNCDVDSADYDTYHPHFHMLVAVNPSYFKSRNYISRDKLRRLWADCLRIKDEKYRENLQVDIRACTGTDAHAVAECSKYATKASDYLIFDDWDLTVDTVRTLDKALANRRLVNYSGVMRDVKRLLKISDVDDDNVDLTRVSDCDSKFSEKQTQEMYFWHSGYSQYYKVK